MSGILELLPELDIVILNIIYSLADRQPISHLLWLVWAQLPRQIFAPDAFLCSLMFASDAFGAFDLFSTLEKLKKEEGEMYSIWCNGQ